VQTVNECLKEVLPSDHYLIHSSKCNQGLKARFSSIIHHSPIHMTKMMQGES
jgi:hypothetical protein